MLVINEQDVLEKARTSLRQRRVDLGFTQAGLAKRADVKLATLRKFEQTGKVSFETLLKLALVLDYLTPLAKAFDSITENFKTMEDLLKKKQKSARQRGRIT